MERLTKTIKIQLPEHVMAWYERTAKQDGRSKSGYMRTILEFMLWGEGDEILLQERGKKQSLTLRVAPELVEQLVQYYDCSTHQAASSLLIAYWAKFKDDVMGVLFRAFANNQTQKPKL